ncbi:MAG: PTS sugar transporter subunit IIA [Planctomycetes bacterium]|nr:PTS sugar transporter subunit IIA [Planctomycetota bacterium]
MKLSSLLNPKLVKCGLAAQTKDEALAEMARVLAATHTAISETELLAALAEREKLGPFSMGRGIAFPHARTEKVRDFTIVLATAPHGVDFRAPDGHKVRIVLLFAIPKKHSNLYLQSLAAFLNFFAVEAHVQRVLEATAPEELIAAIEQLSAKPRDAASGALAAAASIPSVSPSTTVAKALEIFNQARLEALPVVDAEGNLVGEVTAAAVLHLGIQEHLLALSSTATLSTGGSVEKTLRQHADSPLETVPGLIAPNRFLTVQEDEPLLDVALRLTRAPAGFAYVLRQNKLVGRVTASEVLRRLGVTRMGPENGR